MARPLCIPKRRAPAGRPPSLIAGARSRLPHRVDGCDHLGAKAARPMTSVIQHDQAAGRPPQMKPPRRLERPRDVTPTVDEDGGDFGDAIHVVQHLIVVEKAAVTPVVRDEAGEDRAKARVVVAGLMCPARRQRYVRVLPGTPSPSSLGSHSVVRVREEPGVGGGEVIPALVLRNQLNELVPLTRKDSRHLTSDPGRLAAGSRRDSAEHHAADSVRVPLRIDEGQRRSP